MIKQTSKDELILSIVYIYFNTPDEIVDSISSIPDSIDNISYEIIIVDNASARKLPIEIAKKKSFKIIINTKNVGYTKAVNQAVRYAKGKYLLLVNPDTIFLKDSINLMAAKVRKDSKIGVLGPQLVDKNSKILQSINSMPFLPTALFVFSFLDSVLPNNPYSKKYWLRDLDKNLEQNVDFVSGACIVTRKSVFDRVGGLDERFFMYFDEADYCYRVKKLGYQVIYFPKAKVVHLIGKSSQNKDWIQEMFEQSRFRFFRKYHGFVLAAMAEGLLRAFSRAGTLLNRGVLQNYKNNYRKV